MSALVFRNLLEAGDVDGLRAQWAALFPHLPQPETREQAEIVMHRARTEAESLPLSKRTWSHRWLVERGLPSGLPDGLRPSAEQLCPIPFECVGISVNFSSPLLRPAKKLIERAMAEAVEDAFADGRREPEFVSARMAEARAREERGLFGALGR